MHNYDVPRLYDNNHWIVKNKIFNYNRTLDGGGLKFADYVLSFLSNTKQKSVIEVGAGLGFIGISLILNNIVDKENILFSDINSSLTDYYKSKNFNFVISDLFKNIPNQKFKLIIANLPYYTSYENFKKFNIFKTIEGIKKECYLDKNFSLHKSFFQQCKEYIDYDTKIIIFGHEHELENYNYFNNLIKIEKIQECWNNRKMIVIKELL